MKKLLLILTVFVIAFGSCRMGGKRVSGSGSVQTEEHKVGAFKNVLLSGGMDVILVLGEAKPVKIEADDNLLQYIEVKEEGDDLIIGQKPGYNLSSSDNIKVYVTAPVFHQIHLSGAGTIYSESKLVNADDLDLDVSGAGSIKLDLKAPSVKASLSGAGSIRLKGDTKSVDLELSGVGSAHCYELLSENTKVNVSGVGSAEVYASVAVDANVSGVGSVHYKGGASSVTKVVSGMGSVKQVD